MSFRKTSSALLTVLHDLTYRVKEEKFNPPTAGDDFVLAPGKLTVIGAPPGTGKTALAMQLAFETMEAEPDLRLWIANAEMDIEHLMKRELARRSEVSLRRIQNCDFVCESQFEKILDCGQQLGQSTVRSRYMEPPVDLEEITDLQMAEPGLLVLDYLQKFAPRDSDPRSGVNEVMDALRMIALEGWAVLAMSSTTRGMHGHDHAKLNLSSFKESGEIEFNADAAYVLRDRTDDPNDPIRLIDLDCVKNRNGARTKRALRFHAEYMSFEPRPDEPKPETGGHF